MFKRFINGQSKTITSAAMVIGAASLTSRFLGLFRDRILAGAFGAGADLDMYYAAFRLPDLVYNLLVLGALSAGFIPIFVGYIKNYRKTNCSNRHLPHHLKNEDNKEAWQLANNILNILVIALIIVCGILILFAPLLVKIVAPGFNLEQSLITTKLIRIMFLSPIFLGLSSVFGGILQSFKRFFIYSFAPIFYNLGIIIGVLCFVKFWGIYGLAWGVILGAFLHFVNQLIGSLALGYKYERLINFKHKGTKKILKMMTPRALTLAVAQINLLVITIIASTLEQGSISVFNFANNLQSFPVGIFGVSFAIAAFPTLAGFAKQDAEYLHTANNHSFKKRRNVPSPFQRRVGDNLNSALKNKFIKSFSTTFRQILFFVIPVSLFLIVLRAQTVRIVLGGGQFDWRDTILTMNVLAFFSISLFSQALSPLLVRGFYACHDSRTPFYAALFGALVNIVLSLFFTKFFTWGVLGLALAFSISSWTNMGLLFLALRSKIGRLDGFAIFHTAIKIIFAAMFAALTTQSFKYVIEPITGTETLVRILTQTAIAALAGLLIYGLLCWLLRVEEFFVFFESFKKRLLRFRRLPAVNVSEEEDVNVG